MATDLDGLANQLKDIIRNTPPDILHETVYTCFANFCVFITTFKAKQGAPGWSSHVVSENTEEPLLSRKDQHELERLFSTANTWLLPFLNDVKEEKQKGGALPSFKEQGSLIQSTSVLPALTADDVSLDLMFQKFLDKTAQVDKFWDTFAHESPGFAKKLNSDLIVTIPRIPPYLPVPINVPVPKKPLALFLIALIDSLRMSAALAGTTAPILTLFVVLEEVLTGQWRQALLTSAGFFTPSGMAIGIIAKYMVNAWMLMSPDARSTILMDVFQGSKSLLIGFLLWSVNTLTPLRLKDPIARALKEATSKVEEFEGKVKNLEAKASAKLEPLGYRLQFPGLDFSPIKNISMDDLQNLQALARWDMFVCSAEFQNLVKPLAAEPITRLAIELLGIPTIPEEKYKLCKRDEPYPSLAEGVMAAANPQLIALPGSPKLPGLPEIPEVPQIPKELTLPSPLTQGTGTATATKGGKRKRGKKTRRPTKVSSRINRHTRKLMQKH